MKFCQWVQNTSSEKLKQKKIMEITNYQKSGLIPLLSLLLGFFQYDLYLLQIYTHRLLCTYSSGLFSSGNWNLISSCIWKSEVSKTVSSSHLGSNCKNTEAEVNFCESGLPSTSHVNYSGVFLNLLLSTNTGRWQHQL